MTDEKKECPLCIEPLSNIENDFYPCPCGYQICSFCFQHIMEGDEKQRRCPLCRRPYDADAINRKGPQFKPIQESKTVSEYYISPKIVQVIGLPEQLLSTPTLRQDKCFGQYGPIQKISIDPSTAPSAKTILPNTTKSVFVKFENPNDAKACIFSLDGFNLHFNGQVYPIQASLAVVEQCTKVLNKRMCNKRTCLKMHRQPKSSDVIISPSDIESRDPNVLKRINPQRPANYDLFPKRAKSITIFPPLRLDPPVYFPFVHTQIYSPKPLNLYDLFMFSDEIPPAKLPGIPSETVPLAFTLNLDQEF